MCLLGERAKLPPPKPEHINQPRPMVVVRVSRLRVPWCRGEGWRRSRKLIHKPRMIVLAGGRVLWQQDNKEEPIYRKATVFEAWGL